MRIQLPQHAERFGAVRVHEVQEVLELDSGLGQRVDDLAFKWQMVRHVPYEALVEVVRRLAIVVPCKGERLKVLEGVLAGIPHDCLIILVSNSARREVDRFRMEREAVSDFCQLVERPAVIVHQKDPGLGMALVRGGLPELVDEDGLVRDGKGEGMLVGTALAALSGRDFVGFVDADNYIPGAVHEYVTCYAAGFHLARSPYAMVRISWRSKPQIQENRLFFNRWGRTSQVTNRFLNLLLAEYSGFGTEIIATGNAGEHALTMDLATRMRFAGGFAVEPHQYLDMFEMFGGVEPSPHPEIMREGVEVFQIETRNPHLHEKKSTDHIQDMRLQALEALYHSPISTENVRGEILEFLVGEGLLGEGVEPARQVTYPPLERLDLNAFLEVLVEEAETFEQVERVVPTGVAFDAPIPLEPGLEYADLPPPIARRSDGGG